MRHFAPALGILMAAGLACQALPQGSRTTEMPSDPEILFQDDFNDGAAGNWHTAVDADSVLAISNGTFQIQIKLPQRLIWSTPGQAFTDVRVEVDATGQSGPDSAEYGLICRYSEDPVGSHNFYYMVVAGDRSAAIVKVVDNQQIELSSGDITFDEVQQVGTTNHIAAECAGNRISLLVNGTELFAETDDDLPSGDVGVIATTSDEAGLEVLFDNLVVRRPSP